MEIRRNIPKVQEFNKTELTNQPKAGEAEEMQAGSTTLLSVDADVLFAQGDNNTGNTNGNNGTNNNGNNNDNNGANNNGGVGGDKEKHSRLSDRDWVKTDVDAIKLCYPDFNDELWNELLGYNKKEE